MAEVSAAAEFRSGWPVVLTAALGTGLGISGLLTYTAGIFGRDLAAAFGLTRTGLGGAFFLSTLALATALPLAGWLIDRLGPRWPAVGGAVALSAGFAALGTVVTSSATFMLVMAAIGLFAATSAPVAYTRAVNAAFDRGRGLALGFTQVGIGLSAMLVPPVLTQVIATRGWQQGYLLLAGLALIGVVPALLLPNRAASIGSDAGQVAKAVRSRTFLLLLTGFGLMALSFAGLLTHFVPMLREAGMDARSAGALAGVIGLSVVISRVVVGWLADRIEAARIAASCCVLCAVGCGALVWGGADAAMVGAVALGTAMGAEADLIGYMTARHFGMAAYGRLYARQYAGFMLMAGLSPLWIGIVADQTGGYRSSLIMAAGGLILAALVFLRLPVLRTAAS